ncbi:tescalcin-like protein [Cricetulus griseus]|uniref:Tescalcin-like protein n=1 Tax=Cricetulus griseus TaxID=10029 RepID=A0A061HVR1_CRIGR|nr:tescalcin-like protein [Cricetulus griseus]
MGISHSSKEAWERESTSDFWWTQIQEGSWSQDDFSWDQIKQVPAAERRPAYHPARELRLCPGPGAQPDLLQGPPRLLRQPEPGQGDERPGEKISFEDFLTIISYGRLALQQGAAPPGEAGLPLPPLITLQEYRRVAEDLLWAVRPAVGAGPAPPGHHLRGLRQDPARHPLGGQDESQPPEPRSHRLVPLIRVGSLPQSPREDPLSPAAAIGYVGPGGFYL